MKIWKIKGDISARACFDIEDSYENSHKLYNFHSKGTIENWQGLNVSFTSGKSSIDERPLNNIVVFTSYSSLFVCDEYAKEKIEERYDCIQFLPVTPAEKNISSISNYYLPNVLNILNGLDENNCQFRYLRGKYIVGIKKYSFNDSVKKYPVFYIKTSEQTFLDLFATDDFKIYIEKCKISGLTFEEVFNFDNP